MGSGRMVGGFDGWLGPAPDGAQGAIVSPTLASIYAFGLSDNPTLDNLFGMPSGNLRFPGTVPLDVNSYDVGFFGGLAIDSTSANATYSYVRKYANFGLGTTGRTFSDYCFNDPAWNGSANTISGADWIVEEVTANNVVTDDRSGAIQFGKRDYRWASTGMPVSAPSGFNAGFGDFHSLWIWNSLYGLLETTRTNPFGQNASLVSSFVDADLTPYQIAYYYPRGNGTAGGGTGFVISAAFGAAPYGHDHERVGYMGKLAANDWIGGEWYASINAWNPLAAAEHTLVEVAQFWSTVGENIVVGGLQLPNDAAGTLALSDANTIRLKWNQAAGKIQVSANGGAYANLSTVS